MRRFLRDNGLSITLGLLFLASLAGMILAGWHQDMDEALRNGAALPTLGDYIASAGFISALFENWESEFLQMGVYVVLTAMLFQRGSAESRDPDDPGRGNDQPGPGIGGWLYAHSLGLALGALFILSFVLHLLGSWRDFLEEAMREGEAPQTMWQYLGSSRMWFESMQNWQSEFLSTGVLVLLSIILRQVGSPESKPVQAPDAQTGG